MVYFHWETMKSKSKISLRQKTLRPHLHQCKDSRFSPANVPGLDRAVDFRNICRGRIRSVPYFRAKSFIPETSIFKAKTLSESAWGWKRALPKTVGSHETVMSEVAKFPILSLKMLCCGLPKSTLFCFNFKKEIIQLIWGHDIFFIHHAPPEIKLLRCVTRKEGSW